MELNIIQSVYGNQNKISKDKRVSIKELYDVPLIIKACRIDAIKDRTGKKQDKFIFEFVYYSDFEKGNENDVHFSITDSPSIRDRIEEIRDRFPTILYITHMKSKMDGRLYGVVMTPVDYYGKIKDELEDLKGEFYYEDNEELVKILARYYRYDINSVKHRNQAATE